MTFFTDKVLAIKENTNQAISCWTITRCAFCGNIWGLSLSLKMSMRIKRNILCSPKPKIAWEGLNQMMGQKANKKGVPVSHLSLYWANEFNSFYSQFDKISVLTMMVCSYISVILGEH